jgi:hypothetical protein
MRKLTLLLLTVLLVMTAANIHLERVIEIQRDMYARDTELAYEAGVKHGIEQAVDSSPMWRHLQHCSHDTLPSMTLNITPVVLCCRVREHRVPMVVLAGMVLQESSGRRRLDRTVERWG